MVAGGKPLWYLEIFTTGSTLILTIFFVATCISWSGGLDGVTRPDRFPKDEWESLLKNGIEPFRKSLQGMLLWFNIATGMSTAIAGSAFAYLLYRQKIRVFFSWIWFGLVAAFTIVWMATSIILYVGIDDLARKFPDDLARSFSFPLSSIYRWGKSRSSATIIGLIIFPTVLYLFLTFVAYRLYVKLEIYGNENPEKRHREYAPGSWVERKQAAVGGTWEREEEENVPLVKPPEAVSNIPNKGEIRNRKASPPPDNSDSDAKQLVEVQHGVIAGGSARSDSLSGGWGNWLEDVFDYTF